jgi:hypothetical protein
VTSKKFGSKSLDGIIALFIITLALCDICVGRALAEHSEEILLTSVDHFFLPLSSGIGNQLGVFVDYDLLDSSLESRIINAIMKVYDINGRLLKTTSYPSGFSVQSPDGTVDLRTTLTNKSATPVKASVVLTNQEKTELVSNEVLIEELQLGDRRRPDIKEVPSNEVISNAEEQPTQEEGDLQEQGNKLAADPADSEREDRIKEEHEDDIDAENNHEDNDEESISPRDLLPNKLFR